MPYQISSMHSPNDKSPAASGKRMKTLTQAMKNAIATMQATNTRRGEIAATP